MTQERELPTPRTDAEAMETSGNCDDNAEGQALVGIRFARTLERELATAYAALSESQMHYNLASAAAASMAEERDKANAALAECRKDAERYRFDAAIDAALLAQS